jgi:hypothetical protein
MNKQINLTNKAPVAFSAADVFGLFTAASPAVNSGKPAARLNNLWISPNR